MGITIPDEVVKPFCRRWRIRELSVFGSALREDFGPHSDVDVLVSFEADAPWDLFDMVRMRDELAEAFGRPVDFVEKEALKNPYRRKAILDESRLIYATR